MACQDVAEYEAMKCFTYRRSDWRASISLLMTLVLPTELMADCLLVENTLILSKNETRGSFFVYFFLPLSLSELELELEADSDLF